MNICYIVTIPSTIKSFFVSQINFLVSNGFSVTVICSDAEVLRETFSNKVKLISVKIPRGINFKDSIKSVKELIKIFKKEHFDLVQYSTPNAAFYGALAAKWCNLKIRNYHLMGLRYLGAKGLFKVVLKTIEKITCKFSTHIECVSHSNMELGIKEKLFSQEKATVVWKGSTGGVDLNRFDIEKRFLWRQQVRDELNLTQEDFVFGFVGRITADKGINEILGAFSDIKNAKLLIVGDKEGIDTLDQQLYLQSLNNKNIIYASAVSDIERYFASLDVLLLPSYREGFGNVVIEAAALGTPAIVSNIPGPIDAVKRDETALVIPVKNTQELKSAMQFFLDHPDVLEQFSKNCRDYVEEAFASNKLNEKILERKRCLLKMDLE